MAGGSNGSGGVSGAAGTLDRVAQERLRAQAKLEMLEALRGEIEPWIGEEREVAGREALENVIVHLDAEIVEQHRRLEELGEPREPDG